MGRGAAADEGLPDHIVFVRRPLGFGAAVADVAGVEVAFDVLALLGLDCFQVDLPALASPVVGFLRLPADTILLGGGVGGTAVTEQWVPSGTVAVGAATVPLFAAIFSGLWVQ